MAVGIEKFKIGQQNENMQYFYTKSYAHSRFFGAKAAIDLDMEPFEVYGKNRFIV